MRRLFSSALSVCLALAFATACTQSLVSTSRITTVPAVSTPAQPAPPDIVPTAPHSTLPVAELRFASTGYTEYGEWSSNVTISAAFWEPGRSVDISASLRVFLGHMGGLSGLGLAPEGLCLLVTAERTFDSDGLLRLADDEKMSTLLTPTGLAIEGGVQGPVTRRFGYDFQTPLDAFVTEYFRDMPKTPDYREAAFSVRARLPDDLPPGIYRVRLDYGVLSRSRYYSLNGETFAARPFPRGRMTESHLYSPPIPAGGTHVSGRRVDAAGIQPRIPWLLLNNYNSNGYRGVVADEDRAYYAMSNRNLIPDDVILPLVDSNSNRLSYSLEPQFPADLIEARNNIPWDATKGELTVTITGPDGKTVDLGTSPFVAQAGQFPTTRKPAITGWKPPAYGYYTVSVAGWVADIWGNRYRGGGTYHFWIAKRMTLATATFQGVSYPVGSRYGRDLAFAPPVPADVQVDVKLYVNSDPVNVRAISYAGKATRGGVYGAAQGAQPFILDAPGEYSAHILARYTDPDGVLWVESMRHAGVVYGEDSTIVARGKKLSVGGKLVDRGETRTEGNVSHLQHINYPFQSGDVLLIASEQQGANKIEPVLTYEMKNSPAAYDSRLQTIGATNLRIETSNGYSPHLYPEYITTRAYYYSGAPRPGFMSRFLVGENGVRAPYWPTSRTNFGGQIGASSNGDMPGDIYRLVGGVVVRKTGAVPAYAGYLSSCNIVPGGTNNNRIIAPGTDDILGPTGQRSKFFLVGTRIGMVYDVGATFTPAAQVDPILPATVTFTLQYPDGREVSTSGQADSFGSFAGKDRWPLDVAGVYRFRIDGQWQGYSGHMPGLPPGGGEFYVIDKDLPPGSAGLKLNVPSQFSFDPARGFTVSGNSTAQTVYYGAVIPGAAVAQGAIPVVNGKFQFAFDPVAINRIASTYDIVNLQTGRSEIGRVVHLTFFSVEKTPGGQSYATFARLVVRGATVFYAR